MTTYQLLAASSSRIPPAWIPVLIPLWFCFVAFMLSRLGWSRLADAHPGSSPPPPGRTYRRRSGRIGAMMNYNHCLNVTLSGEGIYIVPMWMFRLFHPPLLLPWSGVQSVEEKHFLFVRWTLLVFMDPGGPRFMLYLPTGALADVRTMSGEGNFSAPRLH